MNTGSPRPSGSSNIDTGSGDRPLFQVLALHVCRCWREVALNLPVLWTKLDFVDTSLLNKTKAFIDRAHGLPLKSTVRPPKTLMRIILFIIINVFLHKAI